jgi:hypothetical protein
MKPVNQPAESKLGAGQLWRLRHRYVLILGQEQLSVRFKLLDAPSELHGPTLTGEHDTLWRYLHSRKGKLVGR